MDKKELLQELYEYAQDPDVDPRKFFGMIRNNSVLQQTVFNTSSTQETNQCLLEEEEVQRVVQILWKGIQPMIESVDGINKVSVSHGTDHLPRITVCDSNNSSKVLDVFEMLDRSTPDSLNEALEFESLWGECALEDGFIDRVCDKFAEVLSKHTSSSILVEHIQTC